MADPLQTTAVTIYVLTFNCARSLIDVNALASQLFSNLDALPDLLVLSLQELAPLSQSFLGRSYLAPYFDRFVQAVQQAARKLSLGDGYVPVAVRNLGMTGLMVFARDPSAIQDIETAGIGTGVLEMGNKGAVGVRFIYGSGGASTELTFVGAHLEAIEDAVKQRNENWKSIVRGLIFSSSNPERKQDSTTITSEERPLLSISPRDGSIYKPTSHLFVAGDLNYRTSTLRPSPEDVQNNFPQPYHNTSSPSHFSELFKSDQLNQEKVAGRTLHGLSEAPVTFPPTYKYESVEPYLTPDEELSTWPWASHRWPSWCDRILYLDSPSWMKDSGGNITAKSYTALPLFPTSDHRAVGIEFKVPLVPIASPEDEDGDDPRIHPPFELDIDWKPKRERARALELAVGVVAYLTSTWEGGAIALAMAVGTAGAFFAIQAIIDM